MAWHDGYQVWLSEEQSLQNGQEVVNYFYVDSKDWAKESISALLGNMRHESSINPNMYEYGYDWSADRGYGLVQWTPRSKYWNWAESNGLEPEKGESQLARIDYEVNENIQWIPTGSIDNLTFKEFRTNSRGLSVNELTSAFTWGYERPLQSAGEESMPERQAFANRAFNELNWSGGSNPDPDPDPDPEPIPPEYDLEAIKQLFTDFFNELMESVTSMLTKTMYNYGHKNEFGNQYLKVITQLSNMYKLNPTGSFDDVLQDIANEMSEKLGGLLVPIEPEPDPNPNPTGELFFPVNPTAAGVNFWYPPHDTDLTANMDYGWRTTGAFHAGYDIGGGGNASINIYATTDGIVRHASDGSDGWGFRIEIDHSTDEYTSMYAHLVANSNTVNVGETVKAGQKIAVMGASGGNYAIHLHYELSPTGTFRPNPETNTIDPKPYLKVTGNNQTGLKNPE